MLREGNVFAECDKTTVFLEADILYLKYVMGRIHSQMVLSHPINRSNMSEKKRKWKQVLTAWQATLQQDFNSSTLNADPLPVHRKKKPVCMRRPKPDANNPCTLRVPNNVTDKNTGVMILEVENCKDPLGLLQCLRLRLKDALLYLQSEIENPQNWAQMPATVLRLISDEIIILNHIDEIVAAAVTVS